MSFAEPGWLLLLLLVPLVVWRWLRRRRGAVRYSDARFIAGLPRGRAAWAAPVGAGLRGMALLLLILGLAGLRWPDPGTRLPVDSIAIAMVVDASGSMANRDFLWAGQPISRFEAVKKALRLLLEDQQDSGVRGQESAVPENLISLVTYATHPETVCPLTLNHSVLLQILDAQQPASLSTEATTNTGDAVIWALYALYHAEPRRKVMILFTDGEHNVPPPAVRPRQAARLAANLGIPIYTVQAGMELEATGKPSEESVKARTTLQDVAGLTHGEYFQANDSQGLIDLCRRIDLLERQAIKSFHYRLYHESFAWLGLGALCLWTIGFLLDATVLRKVP